jgi:hypothetical protein
MMAEMLAAHCDSARAMELLALQKIWACMTNANCHVKYNICYKKYIMTKI